MANSSLNKYIIHQLFNKMGASVSININPRKSYGYIRDLPDPNDRYVRISEKSSELEYVDFRKNCGQFYDRLSLASSTAIAVVSAYYAVTGDSDILSCMFLYYNARYLAGNVKYDVGCSIRDCLETLNKIGICKEQYYPYSVAHYAEQPSDKAYNNAIDRKIKNYFRVSPDIISFRKVLQTGIPIIFGLSMPSENSAYTSTFLACGYDNVTKKILVKTSDEQEYLWIPYEYIDKRYVGDCWIIYPQKAVTEYIKKYSEIPKEKVEKVEKGMEVNENVQEVKEVKEESKEVKEELFENVQESLVKEEQKQEELQRKQEIQEEQLQAKEELQETQEEQLQIKEEEPLEKQEEQIQIKEELQEQYLDFSQEDDDIIDLSSR